MSHEPLLRLNILFYTTFQGRSGVPLNTRDKPLHYPLDRLPKATQNMDCQLANGSRSALKAGDTLDKGRIHVKASFLCSGILVSESCLQNWLSAVMLTQNTVFRSGSHGTVVSRLSIFVIVCQQGTL